MSGTLIFRLSGYPSIQSIPVLRYTDSLILLYTIFIMPEKEAENAKELHNLTSEAQEIKKQIAKQMLTLATSGFGLVAALAWNDFIQTLVKEVIRPLIGASSGLISQLIYALIVTVLAVIVTYQLSKIAEKKD